MGIIRTTALCAFLEAARALVLRDEEVSLVRICGLVLASEVLKLSCVSCLAIARGSFRAHWQAATSSGSNQVIPAPEIGFQVGHALLALTMLANNIIFLKCLSTSSMLSCGMLLLSKVAGNFVTQSIDNRSGIGMRQQNVSAAILLSLALISFFRQSGSDDAFKLPLYALFMPFASVVSQRIKRSLGADVIADSSSQIALYIYGSLFSSVLLLGVSSSVLGAVHSDDAMKSLPETSSIAICLLMAALGLCYASHSGEDALAKASVAPLVAVVAAFGMLERALGDEFGQSSDVYRWLSVGCAVICARHLAGSDEATAAVELGRDTTLEKSQESASQETLERINAVTSRIQVLVPQMQSRRRPISSSAYWFDHPEVKAAASFVDKYGTNKTILMAIDYGALTGLLDRKQTDLYEGALEVNGLEAKLWGPGWPGWNKDLGFVENIEAKYGCGYFDVVFYAWMPERWYFSKPFGCGTLFMNVIGDCHYDKCINYWQPNVTNITTTGYAFELMEHLNYQRLKSVDPYFDMQLFSHLPDCANLDTFHPRARHEKPTWNATLFGSNWEFYPIRHRVAFNKIPTWINKIEHPGYDVGDAKEDDKKLEEYDRFSPILAKPREASTRFAAEMRASEICVFDGSMEKKMIRKFAQAMLSGCVVASTLPSESEDEMRDLIIHLDPEWGLEQIHETLAAALADPKELQRKAEAAFRYAKRHFTCSNVVDKIFQLAQMYRNGVRGYNWPSGFSSVCRKYRPDRPDSAEADPRATTEFCTWDAPMPDTM